MPINSELTIRIFLTILVGFIISFAATPIVKSFAEKVGAIDMPGEARRVHNHPIPRMVNASLVALEFASLLPPAETPAHTEGYEGFYHLHKMSGVTEEAELQYIIRDHDGEKFLARKQTMTISMDADLQDDVNAVDEMLEKYYAGCEIVYGVRSAREKDTFFKRSTAEGFYKLVAKLGGEIVYNHADYRLMPWLVRFIYGSFVGTTPMS